MQESFQVPDVSCGHCKATVEGALRPLEGVREAVVDVDSKTASVSYEPGSVSRDRILKAIEDAGYPVAS